MMRKLGILTLIAIMTLPTCRRAEDDPFFTIQSRKSRLTGDWTVERFELYRNYGGIREVAYVKDSNIVYMRADSSTFSRSFSWTIQFESDGAYTSEQIETFPADSSTAGNSFMLTSREKGEWKFTGGNGEPNKSMLLLLAEAYESERSDQGSNIDIVTVSGPVDGEVYSLDRLANDELWMSYSRTVNHPFYSETDSLVLRLSKN